MRSVSTAIWTSGEPVSVSCSRFSAIVAVLSGIVKKNDLGVLGVTGALCDLAGFLLRPASRLLPASDQQ